jgi:hypothetical protein
MSITGIEPEKVIKVEPKMIKEGIKPYPYTETITNLQPDPKLHLIISLIKSSVRIIGCLFGVDGNVILAFTAFGIAEFIGIIEELV